jgi:hypothetical protein
MKALRIAAVGLCLPLLGCYEEPVRDHLHIVFAPGPAIVVTAVREISTVVDDDNQAVEERVDEARSDLAGGWDRWSRGFAEIEAVADRTTVERHDGQARRAIHSALVDSFRPVERLLGGQGLGAFFEDDGRHRELQLYPTGGGQATRQERELLDEGIDWWSQEVSSYLEATTALYRHLSEAPHRAVPCFAHIFDDHPESSGPLTDDEVEMVEEVKHTSEAVSEVLLVLSDQPFSLNELSRLVFDTFQGRLTVAVDGPVVEIEGFLEHPNFVERPSVDLWGALAGMVGQWLAPDLVTAMVAPGPEELQPDPDPVEFASIPRRWAPPPDSATVEAELRSRLRPEEVYRIRWRTRPAPDDEDLAYLQALELLENAERELPE